MRLPIWILTKPEDVETTPIGLRLKHGADVDRGIYDGKSKFVFVFTSLEMAGRYIRLNQTGKRMAFKLQVPHEFVAFFGPLAGDGYSQLAIDVERISDEPRFVELEPLLRSMRGEVDRGLELE